MQRKLALTSAVSGAVLLIGAPVGWYLSQPPETVGDLEALTADAGEPGDAGDDEPTAPAPSAEADAVTDPEPAPEPEPEPAPEPVLPPTRITIPAIGVDAPIVPVGLEPDGAMEIPEDVQTIGWYEPGLPPGDDGTSVLSGHVDSRSQGRGAFFDLRLLDVDDVVTVDHEDGSTSEWRVVARTSYPKDVLPIADIFTRFSPTRLVLITCGGEFDSDTRHYTENIVVYTEPVATSA